MLNYQTPDAFFENSLFECGLAAYLPQTLTLSDLRHNARIQAELVRSLQDIRAGADAIFDRGKPTDDSLGYEDWSRRWSDWANARKAAFFSRAALFMLGDFSYFGYFLNTLRNSHNIVFLGASSDVLQHATGRYLDGPEEDLTKSQLAGWWENFHSTQL